MGCNFNKSLSAKGLLVFIPRQYHSLLATLQLFYFGRTQVAMTLFVLPRVGTLFFRCLNRRAGGVAVTTENATISRLGLQLDRTLGTYPADHTGINGHDNFRSVGAVRAGQGSGVNHFLVHYSDYIGLQSDHLVRLGCR